MKEYLEKYRNRMILMGIFAFLIHGAKLNSEIIGIDTEDLIHLQGDFYGGWQNTGRQGLIALKWLTNSLTFRPFLAGLFTLVLFGAAVSAFFLLWEHAIDKNCNRIYGTGIRSRTEGIHAVLPWVAGGLFLIAHPVITEQFYFTLQSVEICIGIILTAAALYLTARFRDTGKIWNLVIGALILLIPFSSYQAFVVLFIFGTVSILLLEGLTKLMSGENVSAGNFLKEILPYLGVFLGSFVTNTVITKLFFASSDYLGGQIIWGKYPVADVLRSIAGHVVKSMTGYDSVHYHFSLGLLCVAVVSFVIQLCLRFGKGKKGMVCVNLFYLAALFMTQFLMTLICGGAPAVRSQLVLPFLTGFLAYLNVKLAIVQCEVSTEDVIKENTDGEKVAKTNKPMNVVISACVAAICILGIWGQVQTTTSLYYTDRMRYEQDAYLGRELIAEIERVTGGEKMPVAVFGAIPFSGNNACIEGEVIGKSFFDYDIDAEPKYYWSTRRIIGFLHTLGADYEQVTRDRFGNAKIESDYMPVWPAEGSVQIRDRMLVIKLGEY